MFEGAWLTADSVGMEDGSVDESAGSVSFEELLLVHQDLDELFLRHQEALLDRDVPMADSLLGRFQTGIKAHIRLEEDHLLPLFARAGVIRGAQPELFQGEHRKILLFLQDFRDALAEKAGDPSHLTRRILALFDREAMFKHLMEHHDLREKNVLYPTLDQVTTLAERRALLRSQP